MVSIPRYYIIQVFYRWPMLMNIKADTRSIISYGWTLNDFTQFNKGIRSPGKDVVSLNLSHSSTISSSTNLSSLFSAGGQRSGSRTRHGLTKLAHCDAKSPCNVEPWVRICDIMFFGTWMFGHFLKDFSIGCFFCTGLYLFCRFVTFCLFVFLYFLPKRSQQLSFDLSRGYNVVATPMVW